MPTNGPALAVHPCRNLCDWSPTRRAELWACAGCGSQWETRQGWTPRQADGSWPAGLREVLDRSPRGDVTNARRAAAADSADS